MSYITPRDILDAVQARLDRGNVVVRGAVKQINNYYKLADGEYAVDLDFGQYEGANYISSLVEITGYLTYYVHQGGGVYPRVRVKEIKVLEQSAQKSLLEELREFVRTQKRERVFVDELVQAKGFPLRVLVIHGRGAQTHADFIQGFSLSVGKYRSAVSFDFLETGLSDEELAEVFSELKNYEDFDAVFLVRGGGAQEELSRVGGTISAKAILQMGKPFYLAIGHSFDRNVSFLEFIADQTFDTPSLAGVSLGKAVRRWGEFLEMREELRVLGNEVRFLEQFKENQRALLKEKARAERELERVRKNLSYAYYAVAVLLGILFFFLLRFFIK